MKSFFSLLFWRSFFLEFYLGKFGRIRAKIFRTPKILPVPTLMIATERFIRSLSQVWFTVIYVFVFTFILLVYNYYPDVSLCLGTSTR